MIHEWISPLTRPSHPAAAATLLCCHHSSPNVQKVLIFIYYYVMYMSKYSVYLIFYWCKCLWTIWYFCGPLNGILLVVNSYYTSSFVSSIWSYKRMVRTLMNFATKKKVNEFNYILERYYSLYSNLNLNMLYLPWNNVLHHSLRFIVFDI